MCNIHNTLREKKLKQHHIVKQVKQQRNVVITSNWRDVGLVIAKFVLAKCSCQLADYSYALQQTDTFEFFATEHFRISGVYWGRDSAGIVGTP